MYALLTTTLTLILTTTTSANPLVKRNIGGIRLCDQINWAGNCWYGVVPLNECIALNSLYVLSLFPIVHERRTTCLYSQPKSGKPADLSLLLLLLLR